MSFDLKQAVEAMSKAEKPWNGDCLAVMRDGEQRFSHCYWQGTTSKYPKPPSNIMLPVQVCSLRTEIQHEPINILGSLHTSYLPARRRTTLEVFEREFELIGWHSGFKLPVYREVA